MTVFDAPTFTAVTDHRPINANIAIRVGRPLRWNPETKPIVGDSEAQSRQARAQRKGYEIVA
jgi:hypothetical protein